MHTEKYNEGYQAGFRWDRDWTPGGPFVYTARWGADEKSKVKEAQSRQDHADWMQGWRDGKAAQEPRK